jgi:hypothetical protein
MVDALEKPSAAVMFVNSAGRRQPATQGDFEEARRMGGPPPAQRWKRSSAERCRGRYPAHPAVHIPLGATSC